jgi:hypothetical protein
VSILDRFIHRLLLRHPDPSFSADSSGQLFGDSTGQPIGDTSSETSVANEDWEDSNVVEVFGLVQERSGKWPEGPGAGPELVDTKIWLPFGTDVRELDKLKRTDSDPAQVYQVVFANRDVGGVGHHVQVRARRIPL